MSRNLEYKCDVVIIGGGLAGIVTALELLDHNKNVIILERHHRDNFGGLARHAFGGITMVGTPIQKRRGIPDTPELAWHDWLACAQFEAHDLWPRQWAETYVQRSTELIYAWLIGCGIKFFPVVHWAERGYFGDGNSVPRWHITWGTGRTLIHILVNRLRHHRNHSRLQLKFQHNVDELLFNNGRVIGCAGVVDGADDKEPAQLFVAKGDLVVIASGGVAGNIPRVRDQWTKVGKPVPQTLLNGSHPYADGRMHDRTEALGGRVTYLDRIWNYAAGVHHPSAQFSGHGLSLVPPRSALWVNYEGRGFSPMPLVGTFDTPYLVEQICAQPKQYSWQILNWRIAKKELAVSGAQYNDALANKKLWLFFKNVLCGDIKLVKALVQSCPDFVVADTLEGLVDKMNKLQGDHAVRLDLLQKEITTYDGHIDRGPAFFNNEQLRLLTQVRRYAGDRLRTCKFQKILDPKALPLIAVREFILTRKSLGGIQTNLHGQVLRRDGTPLPGLFAVGESAGFGGGGIHGRKSLEGTFLGGCVLTGRLAAQAIAQGVGG